jgi:hypothetical protein
LTKNDSYRMFGKNEAARFNPYGYWAAASFLPMSHHFLICIGDVFLTYLIYYEEKKLKKL